MQAKDFFKISQGEVFSKKKQFAKEAKKNRYDFDEFFWWYLTFNTSQDATPVTFNLPVDMSSLKAEHFEWGFPDGSTRKPHCALPGGAPANEPNELETIAIVGDR